MKTNLKKRMIWMLMVVMVMTASVFTSCGSDSDDSNDSGVTGWYINRSAIYTSSDFSTDVSHASSAATLFHDNGLYWPDWSNVPTGNPDGTINLRMEYYGPEIDFIHIVDGNTLYYYENPNIYMQGSSGSSGLELLYQVNGGSYGKLGFYGNPVRYNYTREGNNIVISQGSERVSFAITSSGLKNNDSAEPILTVYWTKYNPNTVY